MTTSENVENTADPVVSQQGEVASEEQTTDLSSEQGKNIDTEGTASLDSEQIEETSSDFSDLDSTGDHSGDYDEHGGEAADTEFKAEDPDVTVGRYANVREASKQDVQEFSIDELVRSTLAKVDHVFVPPEGLESWEEKYDPDKSLRIFFVAGDSRTGRFSCAVRLGRYLLESSGEDAQRWHYYLCRSRDKEARFITDILPHNDIQEHSIYFIEDVFQTNIRLSGTEQYLDIVHKILVEQDAYLMLTGQKNKPLDARIQKIETGGYNLVPALEKHLDWYNSEQRDRIFISDRVCRELKLERYDEVLRDLHTPVQVNQLCVRISDQQFSAEEESNLISLIIEIAHEIGQDDRLRVRNRFVRLPENVKFLALLVGLFQGIERPVLEELYTQETTRLREQGLQFQDPRQEGLDDLFLRIGVDEGEHQRLRFVDPFMEQEIVARQIPNYRHLLWSVMERVVNWIDLFRDPALWEFRMLLGEAIGRLGQYRPEAMEVLLDQIAMRSEAQVVV
jgi:hypothetical protein